MVPRRSTSAARPGWWPGRRGLAGLALAGRATHWSSTPTFPAGDGRGAAPVGCCGPGPRGRAGRDGRTRSRSRILASSPRSTAREAPSAFSITRALPRRVEIPELTAGRGHNGGPRAPRGARGPPHAGTARRRRVRVALLSGGVGGARLRTRARGRARTRQVDRDRQRRRRRRGARPPRLSGPRLDPLRAGRTARRGAWLG